MRTKNYNTDIEFEKLQYYYLLSLIRKFDIFAYTTSIVHSVNRAETLLLANKKIESSSMGITITADGIDYMNYLRKKLKLKGVSRFLIPSYDKKI